MKRRVSGLLGRRWVAGRRTAGWLRRHVATKRQRAMAAALVGLTLAGVIIPLLSTPQKAEAAAWWGGGSWEFRRKITFNNSASSENLVNFPVRVSLSASNISYAETQNSGQDLRFTDGDGAQLSHEIEVWNEAGTSEVWVKVPQIDAASTTDFIYMYYGNDTAADGQDADGVWGSDYKIVYHMDEAAGDLSDSAGTAQNAIRQSSTVAQTTGKIGSAQDFSSTGYTSTANPGLPTGDFTYETWVYLDNNAAGTLFIGPDSASEADARMEVFQTFLEGSVDGATWTSSEVLPTSSWHHVALTRSGSTVRLYDNGSQVASGIESVALDFGLCDLLLGADTDSGCAGSLNSYLNGRLDEFRVSGAARSADWEEAAYITGNNAMNSFGSAESGPFSVGGDWTYRRKITFNNASSTTNLNNFPVRVAIDSTRINYNNTQDAGQDIRFVSSDNTAQLSHEIETWNESGTSVAWVKVPQIAAGTVTNYIWMYYGNSGAPDGQDSNGTWDSNFKGVWHLDQDPSVVNCASTKEVCDSTGNGNDADSLGSMTSGDQVAGIAGGSLDFDGSDDYLSVPTSPSLSMTGSALSISGWIKPADTTPEGSIAYKGDASLDDTWWGITFEGSDTIWSYTEAGTLNNWDTGVKVEAGVWQFVQTVYNGNTVKLYIDGVQVAQDSYSGTLVYNTDDLQIGLNPWTGTTEGQLDEIRVSDIDRSADWVKAEYRTMNDAFNTFGSEETQGPTAGAWCNIATGATCNSNWLYRRKITFNNSASSAALSNFPVRVSLTKSQVNYSNTQNSGQDLRFVDSGGTTLLSHEIEAWNESGTSEVWVKVPQLDATNTDYIWMYYGNASAADGQDTSGGVWDSNYKLVQHLSEASATTTTQDATSNNNDGTKLSSGNPASETTGQIGGAQDFSSDRITVANSSSLQDITESSFTFSAWAKPDTTPSGTGAFDYGILSKPGFHTAMTYTYQNVFSGVVYNTSDSSFSDNGPTHAAGQWHYVTLSLNSATKNFRMYVDGVQEFSNSYTGTLRDYGTVPVYIGAGDTGSCGSSWTWCFDGKIDEARISSTNRSADWIRAEYLTGANAMNSFGREETQSATPSDAWCSDNIGVMCNGNWGARMRIHVIGSPSGSLSDFPVMVKLSAAAGNIDYSKTQNSGQDIRFVDPSDPSTVLPHEIETWNESGDSYVWVKVPQITTGSSGYIWMYFSNGDTADGQDTANVWSNGYRAVYHMDEQGGTSLSDSTGNANTSTKKSAAEPNPLAVGPVGPAQDFDGTDDYSRASDSSSLDISTAGTVSAVVNRDSAGTWDGIVVKGDSNSNSGHNYALELSSTNKINFQVGNGGDDNEVFGSTTVNSTSEDYYIAGVWDAASLRVYLNGIQDGILASPIVPAGNSGMLRFGEYYNSGSTIVDPFDGAIDEVRISNVARSDIWLESEYRTAANTMLTYDPAESAPLPPPTLTPVTVQSTTPTFQLRGVDFDSPSYLRYKIEVCSDANCDTVVRTIDQTASQTGWSGQDSQTGTAYVAAATLSGSTLASHTYQAPALSAGTIYWWRGYAIDPSGDNVWSSPSATSQFSTPAAPAAPTLIAPGNGSSADINPVFRLWTTDLNNDAVQYKVEVCADSSCSSVVRTIDQTLSQTGWSTQNALSLTAYTTGTTLAGGSQQAYHVYQGTPLANDTEYWWRAYAYDPSPGSQLWSPASPIYSFDTNHIIVRVQGGTEIRGGTKIGN